MSSSDRIDATARLLAGAAAPDRSLQPLVTMLPQLLPGCAAATATRWRDGKPTERAASSGSAADLVASELERDAGPVMDAMRSGHAWCPDTRDADRWPAFRADAMRAGIRCVFTVADRGASMAVSVSLYGVKPGSISLDTAAFACLLLGSGVTRPAAVRCTAASAQPEAAAVLRRALGAGEREARQIIRATSRECGAGVGDVARWLAGEQARAVARIRDSAPARSAGEHPVLRPARARASLRRSVTRIPAVSKPSPQAPDPADCGQQPQQTGHAPTSAMLASQVQRAKHLRGELAGVAALLAQTEARLADTLDRTAESLPRHADQLSAQAESARRYSLHVDQLASNFRREPDETGASGGHHS